MDTNQFDLLYRDIRGVQAQAVDALTKIAIHETECSKRFELLRIELQDHNRIMRALAAIICVLVLVDIFKFSFPTVLSLLVGVLGAH